ncbi:MAG: efflux RND transporter periplasmic adaptor subunit, partial [Granulosicoccaceae bacterium]
TTVFSADGQAPTGGGAPPAMPVMVVEAKHTEATFYKDYPGRVSALRSAEVRARVDGIVQSRDFVEGSQVKADDTLFTIDDRLLRANVRTAKADVDSAEATHALDLTTLKRYRKLLKSGSMSRQEYDTYDAASKQSAAGVEQAKARLESAEINLAYSSVIAPISGRIGRAMVTEGALVSAAGSTPLAKIEQIDQVYVDFSRPSSEVIGQSSMTTQAEPLPVEILVGGEARRMPGMLQFAGMDVDVDTGAISLRALVDNPERTLLPGMFVRVRVPVESVDGVLTVPQKAIEIGPRGAQVHTVVDGKLQPIPVILGKMTGKDWVIDGGLDEGTQVVVSDITMIKAMGASVQAVPADSAAAPEARAEQ